MLGKIKKRWKMILSTILIVILMILSFFITYPLVSPKEPNRIPRKSSYEYNDYLFYRTELVKYPMSGQSVRVNNSNFTLGFAGQTYELHFGKIPLNSSTTKILNMSSKKDVKIKTYKFGNISNSIIVDKEFWLSGEKELKVKFEPEYSGNFTGVLMIRSIIPNNVLSKTFLKWL
ncbi:MAG: hypothetical protein ABEK17_00070 [Candidatus Aenigmatarchaeota archaeon]